MTEPRLFALMSDIGLSLASISDWPISAWVILLAVIVFVGEYLYLLARRHHSRETGEAAEKRLSLVASALRDYAQVNGGRLPGALPELRLSDVENIVYRSIPELGLDEKLVLVHDRTPTHKIIEFPSLRDGRGLVFCSGRMHVVTEEIFDKLLFADDALRERLDLEPIATSHSPVVERTRDAG